MTAGTFHDGQSVDGTPVTFDFYDGNAGAYVGHQCRHRHRGHHAADGHHCPRRDADRSADKWRARRCWRHDGTERRHQSRSLSATQPRPGFTLSGTAGTLTALGLRRATTPIPTIRSACRCRPSPARSADQFISQSIAGGAITVYASNGAPVNVQLRWAKTDSAARGGTDTWNLYYLTNSKPARPKWRGGMSVPGIPVRGQRRPVARRDLDHDQ